MSKKVGYVVNTPILTSEEDVEKDHTLVCQFCGEAYSIAEGETKLDDLDMPEGVDARAFAEHAAGTFKQVSVLWKKV